jgi:copper chaperone CopZ
MASEGAIEGVSELQIEGMHCGACVSRVKKALDKVQGLLVDDVKVGLARVRVGSVQPMEIVRAIEQAGFRVRMPEEG